jgi:hypothetical protein
MPLKSGSFAGREGYGEEGSTQYPLKNLKVEIDWNSTRCGLWLKPTFAVVSVVEESVNRGKVMMV